MVSPIAYVRTYTGIDISLPLECQDISAVDAALVRSAARHPTVDPTPTPNEAIYDAVVGIDRVDHCGFDRMSDQPERLRMPALRKLSELATGLQQQCRRAESRAHALQSIVQATDKYEALLNGARDGVAKDRAVIGSRHTLIRGGNGDIFEMTNSMTKDEIARLRRKTNMHISAVEKAERRGADKFEKESMHRIVLGVGSFGKARIARNICTDQYMAVKKSHPALAILPEEGLVCNSPVASRFSMLPDSMKRALRHVGDAVITPDTERLCQSKKSVELNRFSRLLSEYRDIDEMSMAQLNAFAALSDQPAVKNFNITPTRNALFAEMESIICCRAQPLKTDAVTLYSFSEVGLGNMQDAAETLSTLRFHLEGKKRARDLSPGAVRILAAYAQVNGAPHPELTLLQLTELRRRQGLEIFNHPDFCLNDPEHNKKYCNTLGKKLISTLSKFHSIRFSHRDIKPANIVFTQDSNETISVKLIDIDSIKSGLKTMEKAQSGTPLYMAPELHLLRNDDAEFFDAEKSDSYAMGLTLRTILGFTEEEVNLVTYSQIEKSFSERATGEAKKNITFEDEENIRVIRQTLKENSLSPSSRVRTPSQTDRNASLLDISDFLLQSRVKDRCTAADVLAFEFFDDPKNFLSDADFTKQTNFMLRFQAILDKKHP